MLSTSIAFVRATTFLQEKSKNSVFNVDGNYFPILNHNILGFRFEFQNSHYQVFVNVNQNIFWPIVKNSDKNV